MLFIKVFASVILLLCFCLSSTLAQNSAINRSSRQVNSLHSKMGMELLSNPTFSSGAKGWFLRDASTAKLNATDEESAVLLNGVKPGPNSWSHVGTQIKEVPCSRKLNFSCRAFAKRTGQKLMVNAFAYDSKDEAVARWTDEVSLDKDQWKKYENTYVVPEGTTYLTIWIVDQTEYPIYVSRPNLRLGAVTSATVSGALSIGNEADSQATKILHVKYKTSVRSLKAGDIGTVTFPIPGLYREQVPLTFTVKTEPSTALVSCHLSKRADGINWIASVIVKPPGRGVIVRWESLVLVSGRKKQELPTGNASVPEAVSGWTKSTLCVQSRDPAIRAKAEELARGTTDVGLYASKVIAFTSTNNGRGAPFDALDAKRALECGGSCTSRANLAAALFRARGIPARTLSHMPAWYSGPFYEHWLVEYWHPGAGWVWLESTLGQVQPAPNTLVVLAVSNATDEDGALDPVHLRGIMRGAAFLSGCEFSRQLQGAGLVDPQANSCEVQITLKAAPLLIEKLQIAARRNFNRMFEESNGWNNQTRTAGISAAVKSGRVQEIADALTKMY